MIKSKQIKKLRNREFAIDRQLYNYTGEKLSFKLKNILDFRSNLSFENPILAEMTHFFVGHLADCPYNLSNSQAK